MQAASTSHAEDRAANARRIVGIASEYRRSKCEVQPWQHHHVRHDLATPFPECGWQIHGWQRRTPCAAGNRPVVLLDEPPCLRWIEVASNREDCVVWRVVCREEMRDVFEACF